MFTFKSEFVVDKLKKNKGILWKSKIPFFWVANFFLQNRTLRNILNYKQSGEGLLLQR